MSIACSQLDSQYKKCIVSREHARLTVQRDHNGALKFTLSDLESTNGICVNAKRVAEAVLKDNDLITFGGAGKMIFGNSNQDVVHRSDVNYRFKLATQVSCVACRVSRALCAHCKPQGAARKRKSDSSAKSNSKVKPLRFRKGNQVEAKSRNTQTGEADAWFDVVIVACNARKQTYVVRYEGYGDEFNESLEFDRVRLVRAVERLRLSAFSPQHVCFVALQR